MEIPMSQAAFNQNSLSIVYQAVSSLKPRSTNPRTHSKKQIGQSANVLYKFQRCVRKVCPYANDTACVRYLLSLFFTDKAWHHHFGHPLVCSQLCIKTGVGKLQMPEGPEFLEAHLRQLGVREYLSITLAHIRNLKKLPPIHKDPFDRMLVAQASSEQMSLVSKDEEFQLYQVKLLW